MFDNVARRQAPPVFPRPAAAISASAALHWPFRSQPKALCNLYLVQQPVIGAGLIQKDVYLVGISIIYIMYKYVYIYNT